MPSCADLVKMAKRMVAASCCAFLNGVTPESVRNGKERWIPYMNWMQCLKAEDSILTFNYDLVVEMLRPQVGNSGWGVHVAGFGDDSMGRAQRIPMLYKLHGSVNWHLAANGQVSTPNWTPAMLANDKNLAIATPGDSKMKMAGGLFGRLWDDATTKLREAEEVYIIGFRFPQGDAFPRNQLLEVLRSNFRQTSTRNVHVILGPGRGADQSRVLALLQWSLGARAEHDSHRDLGEPPGDVRLFAHAAYAEDFLDSWALANRGW